MVVVVADAILEARWRSRGLNAPDQAFSHQDAECVVHRLERDGTDLNPDSLGDSVSRDVGLAGHGTQDRQSLGGDLNATLPKEISRVGNHDDMLDQYLE